MQRGSANFLRAAVISVGLLIVTVGAVALPIIHREWGREFPDVSYMRYLIILGVAAGAAILAAFHHALKLLEYIDNNKSLASCWCSPPAKTTTTARI